MNRTQNHECTTTSVPSQSGQERGWSFRGGGSGWWIGVVDRVVDRSEAEQSRARRTARVRSRHENSAPRPFRAVKGSSDGQTHQTPSRMHELRHGAGSAPGSIALAHRHADNLTAMQRNASNSSATRGKQRWTLHTFCAPTQFAAQHAQRGSACHTSGATARLTVERTTSGNTPPKTNRQHTANCSTLLRPHVVVARATSRHCRVRSRALRCA
jgi:hypothetical protein